MVDDFPICSEIDCYATVHYTELYLIMYCTFPIQEIRNVRISFSIVTVGTNEVGYAFRSSTKRHSSRGAKSHDRCTRSQAADASALITPAYDNSCLISSAVARVRRCIFLTLLNFILLFRADRKLDVFVPSCGINSIRSPQSVVAGCIGCDIRTECSFLCIGWPLKRDEGLCISVYGV